MADNEFYDQSQRADSPPEDDAPRSKPAEPGTQDSGSAAQQSGGQDDGGLGQQSASSPQYRGAPSYPARAPYSSGVQDPSAQQPAPGYAQSTAGYPTGSYPTAGYPTAGYPTAGYPPTGYAEAGYGIDPDRGRRPSWGAPGPYGSAQGAATIGTATPAPEPPVAERRRRVPLLLVVALVAALIGGGVGAITVAVADRHNGSVDTGLAITNNTAAPSAHTDGTIGAAAAKIRPSVVTINETSGQSGGTGSGVILRSDGYILTNDHVISLAAQGGSLQVTLSDGRTAPGTIVGRDTSDDLAVIKVAGLSNLVPATFGRSSSLTVGQTVVAVGAPLGLSDTVTSGIVSNTARPVRAGDNDQAVFQAVQTDAAINPGNSGGPLVDLNGSVVGINAAIATDSSGGGLQIPGQTQQSGSIGIGFAIPSDEASRIASELIANGKAYHAVLGVSVKAASTSTTAGVTLAAVSAGSGAAKAGLKVGDLITAVDGHLVTTADSLIAAVRSYAPGTQVQISYTRGSSAAQATVSLDKSDQ